MALDLIEELERIVVAFEDGGIEYALCGGLALAAHGHPRMTMDIDLIVIVSREGVATMKRLAGRPQDLADIDV